MKLQKGNKKLYILSTLIVVLLLVFLILFKKSEPKPKIIATIGNKLITQRDFLLNYEFGLPHLKIGETPLERKENYLQFMINEYLLALDAEQIGLDKTADVVYQTKNVKNELLLESIVENDIKPNVNITMDEIKEAINKSKVSFKFFYWPEKDLRNAQIIKEMFEENGIEETFKKLSTKKSDVHFDLSKYTTDYLTWLQIPEETFNAIKDLPANEFSDPVKIDDLYFIFQIQDIRRTSVTTNEYLDKASTFRKILFNGKMQDEVLKYVDNLMTPKDIKTKTKVFNVFADAVIEWYKSDDRGSKEFADWVKDNNGSPAIQKFYKFQDSILITYNGDKFTLGEFQEYFNYDRITYEYQTKREIKNHLNAIIELSIRDYFLVLEAKNKKYDETPWFKHEFMKWSSKFAFEERLRTYMNEKNSDSVSVKDKINLGLDSLRTKYPITIDHAMLDTLKMNETEKSKQSYIQLMKRGIERMAEPIVDGHWKSISK